VLRATTSAAERINVGPRGDGAERKATRKRKAWWSRKRRRKCSTSDGAEMEMARAAAAKMRKRKRKRKKRWRWRRSARSSLRHRGA
jgi:hypothetical protein